MQVLNKWNEYLHIFCICIVHLLYSLHGLIERYFNNVQLHPHVLVYQFSRTYSETPLYSLYNFGFEF